MKGSLLRYSSTDSLNAKQNPGSRVNHHLRACFEVHVKKTKLFVAAHQALSEETRKAVIRYRKDIEDYITYNPKFLRTLVPIAVPLAAPSIVKDMAAAGFKANVGPMAAVAGAIAEKVGKELLKFSQEVVVENGGDIFLSIQHPVKVALYAGASPFSLKLALDIDPNQTPLGICTSAGTVGPSLSFGRADAICVVSKSAAVADAFATSIGNLIKTAGDIKKGIAFAQEHKEIEGVIIVSGDHIGIWGKVKVIALG